MTAKVDLHLHTTASDGKLTPEEVVTRAAGLGLEVIAITDHDVLNGIGPATDAAAAFPGLKVIPGVEISTDFKEGDVHVLGYFIDPTSAKLRTTLEEMCEARQQRARGMIDKLDTMGIHIDWPRVRQIAGDGSVGRPHIAQAMLEKGYISSLGEAFEKYIGRGGPAYVERIKTTPEEAVRLILKSGGLPVLAHPLTIPEPEPLIRRLKAVGLIGLEAYYNGFPADLVNQVAKLAGRYDLITTGGSDYHGLDDSNETMIGGAEVPLEAAQKLIALHEKRALKTGRL